MDQDDMTIVNLIDMSIDQMIVGVLAQTISIHTHTRIWN